MFSWLGHDLHLYQWACQGNADAPFAHMQVIAKFVALPDRSL
jgi:hypothetical protein